jgi:type VI secretion system secreted protein VgrG
MNDATDKIRALLARNSRRMLYLYFPRGDEPEAGFLVNHIEAHEQVSKDFTYIVTVLSDDPNVELTDVQGRMVCVELRRERGDPRYFNGICFEFGLLRIENGMAVYQMVLRPWLALLNLRSNHFLFHDIGISNQSKQLFETTGLSRYEFQIQDIDPPRTFSCQYDETDYNYLHRRWEEMGWHYWYEHTLKGHTLILSDSSTAARPIDGNRSIAWHHSGGSNLEDKIAVWAPRRKLVPGKVGLSTFDFKRPTPECAGNASDNNQGRVYPAEAYHYQDLYGFKQYRDGETIARRRMEQIDSESYVIHAKANHRAVQPGRWFSLKKESVMQAFADKNLDSDFYIIGAKHIADNNYLNSAGGDAHFENEFTCVPRKTPWRPGLGFNSREVKITGIDTALVVGPAGDNIYTDEFGRVRVRFHWDREGQGARSSTWIRVGTPWAGAEQGSISIPRVGSEVLVQWLGGSPDRPIIVGGVHNAAKMPPFALASQYALTGLRSRELTPGGGNSGLGRSNHLVLDDTHERIQAQLKSDHQSSQLSLGHITRIESNAGRKDFRGEGWELATNAWGVARAGKGMLISTDARNDAISHIKDMREAIQRLKDAYNIHDELAESALKFKALEKKDQQGIVVDAIKSQNEGVQGPTGAGFPQLSEPHLILSSPAGIETATAHSTHITSGQHTAITTGKNLSVASGESFFASIAKTFRLFVQQAGMKMVAAAGNIDIQALTDSINVLAKLNITHSANRITISAKEEVVINGAGSYVKFNAAGIEHGTTGANVSHAATHSLVGQKSLRVPTEVFPVFSVEPHSLRFAAVGADDLLGDAGWIGQPFSIKDIDGETLAEGVVAEDGRLPRVTSPHTKSLVLRLGDPDGAQLVPNQQTVIQQPPSAVDEGEDEDEGEGEDEDENADDASELFASPYYQETAAAVSYHNSEFLTEAMVAELINPNGINTVESDTDHG